MNELISVIVPIYNVEQYLKKSINSVLKQTYPFWELVLVDDGSTDRSGTFCDEFQEQDERVHVFHKKNGGVSSARNYGVYCARGTYIFFLDPDDWIEQDTFQILIEKMASEDVDIVSCGFQKIDERGNVIQIAKQETKIYNSREAVKACLCGKAIHSILCAKLYRRELFQNIVFPEGYIHEDEFVIYKLLYKARKISALNHILYNYLQRKNSIMNAAFSAERLVRIDALKAVYNETLKYDETDIQHIAYMKYIETLKSMYICAMKYLEQDEMQYLRPYKVEIFTECKKAYWRLKRNETSKMDLFMVAYFSIYYEMYRIVRRFVKKLFRGSKHEAV